MREVYPLPEPELPPNSKAIEELAREGIEVISLNPFVAYVRSDALHMFRNEAELRAYVMRKLGQVI